MPVLDLPQVKWSLPIAPDPAPGESWSSYFGRTAALNDTTVNKLRQATGIPADDILTPRQIGAAAELVNLHPNQVQDMTLERWTGIAYQSSPHTSRKTQTHRWTWNAARDRCPTCQRIGPTLLAWRLPWITTCARHNRYLSDHSVAPTSHDIEQAQMFHNALEHASHTFFDTWRDAIIVATHLRRIPRIISPGDPPHIRAIVLHSAAPLAADQSSEDRAELLGAWAHQLGLRRLPDTTHHQLRSRLIIDAADAVAAGWYRRRTN